MEIKEESNYYSKGENYQPTLYYTLFTPGKAEIMATLLIVHGMQEHSGRYREIALYFAKKGFAVLTYDHPGHGKSVDRKQDLGFIQLHQPDERLISDAGMMGRLLIEKYTGLAHFILGHSMGSFVTRCLLQRSGVDYAGAILSGTRGGLLGISILRAYFYITNWLWPRRHSFFNSLFNLVNNRAFKNDRDFSDTSWLSLNPGNRKAFNEDDLCGLPFSNNGYYALFKIYARATGKEWHQNIPKSLPFLFVSGADDPIGDFSKGVKQAAGDLKQNHFESVETKLYPKMRHEILNESIREEVLEDVYQWMVKVSGRI